MATILTREDFLAFKSEIAPVRREIVELTEDRAVYVTELTAGAAMAMGRENTEDKDNVFAWMAACVVDEQGNPILTVEDAKNLPSAMFNELAKRVLDLNGLIDSEKSVEEAEKNSETVA